MFDVVSGLVEQALEPALGELPLAATGRNGSIPRVPLSSYVTGAELFVDGGFAQV